MAKTEVEEKKAKRTRKTTVSPLIVAQRKVQAAKDAVTKWEPYVQKHNDAKTALNNAAREYTELLKQEQAALS